MTHGLPDPPATLVAALPRAARAFPDRGIAIFDGRGRSHARRTYPEVLAASEQAAGRWATLGVQAGDRVLVCLPTSWPMLDAWLGALLLGALPVAIAPPGAMGGGEAHVRKVDALAERLGARFVLTTEGFVAEMARFGAPHAAQVAVTAAQLEGAAVGRVIAPTPAEDDIAFLQLTSGSTGLPRAVMIRHRSAIHNGLASNLAIGAPHGKPIHQLAESMVSWLPLNHDMGLVGCLFLSIVCGLDLWLMQPTTFLARPRLWLEHLGKHGTAFTPAPNFGYQLCVERLGADSLDGIDLAPWHDAMTGAEMVRPETVQAFCDRFGPRGFRPEAFRPCYGLAEGTLAVTFDQAGRGMRTRPLPTSSDPALGGDEVVSVGVPIDGTTIRITDPAGNAVPDGTIGEVRVEGPSVFAGYWRDPKATAEGLQDGWLVTGDLGFVDDQGELYLTGRRKDILVVRGHNIMPHELEWLAESITGGGGGIRSGAFSVDQGGDGEQPVLVVEAAERDPEKRAAMAREIRSLIGRQVGLPLADLVFVRRGRLPKTTSGKVQRQQLRAHYLAGNLERLD